MPSDRLVHIVDDAPDLASLVRDGEGPVLLMTLDGFLDAGSAAGLAAEHLATANDEPGRVVASFEVDELYDYRARRPPLTFVENRYADYQAPRLVVRLHHDAAGAPYLLLTGPEPDIRWEAFASAVREVIEQFSVPLTVMLGAVPMAVPHTRPVQLTNHATNEELLTSPNIWRGEIQIPSSAQALVELRLGEWGHDVLGFVAHIPHYVAQLPYPQAAVRLVEAVAENTDLTWDLEPLRTAGERQAVEIASQIEDSDEVRQVVHGLEQQYDAFQAGREQDSLLADDRPLPSGEELGAQFEQFLAGLDDPPSKED